MLSHLTHAVNQMGLKVRDWLPLRACFPLPRAIGSRSGNVPLSLTRLADLPSAGEPAHHRPAAVAAGDPHPRIARFHPLAPPQPGGAGGGGAGFPRSPIPPGVRRPHPRGPRALQ
eukprot:1118985-Prorocentrum_minimum.AAC.1